MGLFEKLYTLLILLAVGAGLLIGQVEIVASKAKEVIMPFLMLMLLATFLQMPLHAIKKSFANNKFTGLTVMLNFVVTPILAWGLASLFLADHPALWIGFIMLMVTPCTDWYIIFTGIARGDVALSTSLLPLNLILQILLMPVYLYLFTGVTGGVEMRVFAESMFFVLLLPLLTAYIINRFILKDEQRRVRIFQRINTVPIIFLCLAIMAMFAFQGTLLIENKELLYQLLLPILLFFILILIIGRVVGRLTRLSTAQTASLNLTTLARNSPVALAMALTAFPDEPLIALVLIIGPLVELPALSLLSFGIAKFGGKKGLNKIIS
ncbi:arsenic resistance protein [Jeotgalibacillus soli]|uniref:Arsenic resistance protein n=1 Tax=Jeotgalibacillus soli TaxID=889306 RepID=A0A0C2VZU9_9BACL|nr:bile acid:sodium symporter [Jeotgalibacillus soli]KIL49458.1 hypothetical protein KP78_09260 [Jeotgalibacillus soli]